jgi:hypothetical protein
MCSAKIGIVAITSLRKFYLQVFIITMKKIDKMNHVHLKRQWHGRFASLSLMYSISHDIIQFSFYFFLILLSLSLIIRILSNFTDTK